MSVDGGPLGAALWALALEVPQMRGCFPGAVGPLLLALLQLCQSAGAGLWILDGERVLCCASYRL